MIDDTSSRVVVVVVVVVVVCPLLVMIICFSEGSDGMPRISFTVLDIFFQSTCGSRKLIGIERSLKWTIRFQKINA